MRVGEEIKLAEVEQHGDWKAVVLTTYQPRWYHYVARKKSTNIGPEVLARLAGPDSSESNSWALPTSTIAFVAFGTVVGYPMQILWFSKIATGLIKVLKGASSSGGGNSKGDIKGGAKKGVESPRTTRGKGHDHARVDAFPVGESKKGR